MKKRIKNILLQSSMFKYYFLRRELMHSNIEEFSEAILINYFFKYFSQSKVMIDVGAHYGESFQPYERTGWKVYAFEPDPNNREKIRCVSPTTELFDIAIGNEDNKEFVLYSSNVSTGISSLIPFHESHEPAVKIKTKTLDTFCKEKDIRSVDFLKIDTEGYDYFVLQGFPFQRMLPKIILCEFEDAKTLPIGYSYKELGNFLLSKGYNVYISEWYPIVRYGVQHTWRELILFSGNNELKDNAGWGNFIAVKAECVKDFDKVKKLYLNYLHAKV